MADRLIAQIQWPHIGSQLESANTFLARSHSTTTVATTTGQPAIVRARPRTEPPESRPTASAANDGPSRKNIWFRSLHVELPAGRHRLAPAGWRKSVRCYWPH